ncbi:MAG: sigma-70 family RNA polymerase sigma factor [Elainellaceae cyanobacterium]
MTDPNRPRPPSDDSNTTLLDKALDEILGKDNSYAYTMFSCIKRMLKQYQLHWRMEPHDVLHEAYQRGVAALKAGKAITNPHAWLKKTSLNIIREYSRSKKGVPTDPMILSDIVSDDNKPMEKLIWQEELQDLRETIAIFAREEPEAFELLCLRTLDRLSWQDIAEHWSTKYRQPVNDVALRKKLSRAKKKFRLLFHRLEQSQG